MLNSIHCDDFVMTMKQDNAAGFVPWPHLAKAISLASSLLLFGCSHSVKKPVPPATSGISAATGIAACDTYLNTYLACHRTAGTYPPDALQTHYQAMRDTLLQEAGDPGVRPYLASRCQGLSQQLRDALQGRPCAATAQVSGGTATSH
jgi:hypothetical protein